MLKLVAVILGLWWYDDNDDGGCGGVLGVVVVRY